MTSLIGGRFSIEIEFGGVAQLDFVEFGPPVQSCRLDPPLSVARQKTKGDQKRHDWTGGDQTLRHNLVILVRTGGGCPTRFRSRVGGSANSKSTSSWLMRQLDVDFELADLEFEIAGFFEDESKSTHPKPTPQDDGGDDDNDDNDDDDNDDICDDICDN